MLPNPWNHNCLWEGRKYKLCAYLMVRRRYFSMLPWKDEQLLCFFSLSYVFLQEMLYLGCQRPLVCGVIFCTYSWVDSREFSCKTIRTICHLRNVYPHVLYFRNVWLVSPNPHVLWFCFSAVGVILETSEVRLN